MFLKSLEIEHRLNVGELNKEKLPNFRLNNKTKFFTVKHEIDDVSEFVKNFFTEDFKKTLTNFKDSAKSFNGIDYNSVILDIGKNQFI